MLPLRGVWWAVMLECHSAPADMQTREDCHRWSPRAQLRMLQFSIAQLELPAPWGTLQPSGSRSGLRETLSGPNGQVGRWGRQVHPPVPPLQGAALSCILHLFQPPGGVPGTQPLLPNSMDPTRQQGRWGKVGCWADGGCWERPLLPHGLPLLPASQAHSTSVTQVTPTWEDQCRE